MPEIKPIVAMLSHIRADLLAAAEAFSADLWARSPKADEWSAADVISHLTSVEVASTGGATKMIRSEPHPVSFWRRLAGLPGPAG